MRSGRFNKVILIFCIAIFIIFISGCNQNGQNNEKIENSEIEGDLVIYKSEIDNNVKFYPLVVDGQKMQILAVKTEDGRVRTAFDTCQVCNRSPKAYYEQDGDVVVCQNCGNRFSMLMIEEQKGGCNPIPIMAEDKVETDDRIIIEKEYLKANKNLFTANWRTK